MALLEECVIKGVWGAEGYSMNSVPLQETRPLITVIIPAYNRGEYLARTLDSVFDTGYESFQIIVVDDESTDNTPSVVEPYLKQGVIEYCRIQNDGLCGPARAINTGLARARGELIHCLDADDCVTPSYYEEVLNVFNSNPTVDAVSTFATVIDSNDNAIEIIAVSGYNSPEEFRRNCLWGNQIISSSMIVKRICYDSVGGRRPQFQICCDYDMWIRIGERFNIHLLRKRLVCYRQHNDNISSSLERIREYDRALIAEYIQRNTMEFFLPPEVQANRFAAAKFLYGLALFLESRGFPELMEPFLLASIQRNPTGSDSYAALGSAHYSQGDLSKTEFYAQRALKFNNEHPTAKALLSDLVPPPYKPRNQNQPLSILLVANVLAPYPNADPKNLSDPENSTYELAKTLARAGAHVTVLSSLFDSQTVDKGNLRWTSNDHFNLIQFSTDHREHLFAPFTDSLTRSQMVNEILQENFDLIHFQQLSHALAPGLAKSAINQATPLITFALHDPHLFCSQLGQNNTLRDNNCLECKKFLQYFSRDNHSQELLFKTLQARQRILQILLSKMEAVYVSSQNELLELSSMGFYPQNFRVLEILNSSANIDNLAKALLQVLLHQRHPGEKARLAL